MRETYRLVKLYCLAAPSTISGWTKSGSHPAWVDVINRQAAQLDEKDRLIAEQATAIRTLSRMVGETK